MQDEGRLAEPITLCVSLESEHLCDMIHGFEKVERETKKEENPFLPTTIVRHVVQMHGEFVLQATIEGTVRFLVTHVAFHSQIVVAAQKKTRGKTTEDTIE